MFCDDIRAWRAVCALLVERELRAPVVICESSDEWRYHYDERLKHIERLRDEKARDLAQYIMSDETRYKDIVNAIIGAADVFLGAIDEIDESAVNEQCAHYLD